MVKNILTAPSFVIAKTPAVCVTVMQGMSSAPKYLVMGIVATRTDHLDNAVENVNVRTHTQGV